MVLMSKTGAPNTAYIASGSFSYIHIMRAIKNKTDVRHPPQLSYIQRNT